MLCIIYTYIFCVLNADVRLPRATNKIHGVSITRRRKKELTYSFFVAVEMIKASQTCYLEKHRIYEMFRVRKHDECLILVIITCPFEI